jgi:hypothetical protein
MVSIASVAGISFQFIVLFNSEWYCAEDTHSIDTLR